MSSSKLVLQGAAGAATEAEILNVEDVFSIDLFYGNQESLTVDNGINLGQSNAGGSVHLEPLNSDYTTGISLGSGNYITSGDFTVECFFWIEPLNSENGFGYEVPGIFSFNSPRLSLWYRLSQSGNTSNQKLRAYDTSYQEGSTDQHPEETYANTWVHVAMVRSSGTITVYVDGTSAFSWSNTTDYSGATLNIGNDANATPFQGHISNFRIVNGTAVYTSSFTPPTSELTAISGTTFLAFTSTDTLSDTSGNSHSMTLTNGVTASAFGPFDASASGKGGLVWVKNRDQVYKHGLFDTERGTTKLLSSNLTNAQATESNSLKHFNSSGFTLGKWGVTNGNDEDHVAFSFRKAAGFFDVVSYTGDGTSGRAISHNLGTTVGMIIVKSYTDTEDWRVYHRSQGASKQSNFTSSSFYSNSDAWSGTEPTDSVFYVSADANKNGQSHVAYLFAHNSGDGTFGENEDQDIIQCGTFTGSTGNFVNLGFEPQWILAKNPNATENWYIIDTMRGSVRQSNQTGFLEPNTDAAEARSANGFTIRPNGFYAFNGSGATYVYVAIRRGPMAVPTDARDVFAVAYPQSSPPTEFHFESGFPIDFALQKFNIDSAGTYGTPVPTRLLGSSGQPLNATSTAAYDAYTGAAVGAGSFELDHTRGYFGGRNVSTPNDVAWMWRCAPSFCHVLTWEGNSTAGRTVNHNLGVAPEMMWIKRYNTTRLWTVYHKDLGPSDYLQLNSGAAEGTGITTLLNNTDPTSSVITLGSGDSTNGSGSDYVAYLFASLDNVSKVGSFTHTSGTPTNVDCGFSSGARFVLWKKTDSTDGWQVYDTERGIVAGNDPFLQLNTTDAEISQDLIDPLSSGFTVASLKNSGTYIFYAIA